MLQRSPCVGRWRTSLLQPGRDIPIVYTALVLLDSTVVTLPQKAGAVAAQLVSRWASASRTSRSTMSAAGSSALTISTDSPAQSGAASTSPSNANVAINAV